MGGDGVREHDHSVTRLLHRLRTDDPDAAGEVWRRILRAPAAVGPSQLAALPHRAVDEEDVLVSVFDRFFRAAKQERFARLADRDDLWQILLVLTDARWPTTIGGDGGQARRRRLGSSASRPRSDLREFVDREPGPGVRRRLQRPSGPHLSQLGESTTREVALLRMEGYETREIAGHLGISLSSVERKLRVVREVWQEEFAG